MKQRAVAIVADYLSHRPLGRVVGLKAIADDDYYVLAIEDIRDGRVHLVRTPKDLEPWLRSFKNGECIQPAFGLCGRCNAIHSDRDVDGEVFGNCIPCQAELVEAALELREQEFPPIDPNESNTSPAVRPSSSPLGALSAPVQPSRNLGRDWISLGPRSIDSGAVQ